MKQAFYQRMFYVTMISIAVLTFDTAMERGHTVVAIGSGIMFAFWTYSLVVRSE